MPLQFPSTLAWMLGATVVFCAISGEKQAFGQQTLSPTAGIYPLEDVLRSPRFLVGPPPAAGANKSESEESAKFPPEDNFAPSETANASFPSRSTRAPIWTDGMSPSDWGNPHSLGSQEPQILPDADPYMYADPPAVEPELSPYQIRKAEQKKSPSMREILNKGRYFAAVETLWMEPHFLGSTAMTRTTGNTVFATPFDFGFNFSPRFTVGFESEQGPGLEMKYWNYNGESDVVSFTSDGATVGQTALYLLGPERWSRISADAAGETLSVEHELEAQSFDIEFFKEIEYKISRINGILGLHYATLSHRMRAQVNDAGGTPLGELIGQSEFEGFGPKIGIEYFRPIGHTKLEMCGGLQASLLVGERDQLATNSTNFDFNLFSADELLTGLNAQLGVQYMHHLTEHRTIFARTTLEAQHWIGGGTATNPVSDFGIYGLTFGVGLNR